HALGDGAVRVGDLDGIRAKLVMAASATADNLGVPFGKILPGVPSAGVKGDDSFAAVGVVEEGLAGCETDRLVRAPDEHIHPVENRRHAVRVLREIDPADMRRQGRLVSLAEELHEVVRGTTAHEQDARTVRRAGSRRLRDWVIELWFETR